MWKRVAMIFLTLTFAIIILLLAAKNPTGPNTVSFDEPIGLLLSAGMVVVLFLPPLILAFFQHLVARIVSAIYQGFFVLSFLILIPVGFLAPDFGVIIVAVAGIIISICSIVVTIVAGRKKGYPDSVKMYV
ncbi:hypothetical protein F9U64_20180 [Gracilibacillus oryzae]|uniref:Integral inner membrane protein n=1 Tax=Gracilibacillus oryzae TaxID=1672701 RepID=A0A7C8GR59_9BACI|nr:hypothetical protein [Gracilibacillus oryzae]KAB8126381.1 hypothetical protein F9U64_20180 [Gracilibacillus oryzae]